MQMLKLRDCIMEGLLDRVAVSRPDLGRNAYICADLGPHAPVFVHSASNVSRHRPYPSVLIFNEVISSSMNRPFMRDLIAIDGLSLAKYAAAGANCSAASAVLNLGDFLPVPAPRYLKEQDDVLAFASPMYAPLDYALPTVEISVPADQIFRYKVFARALLEGEVVPGLPRRGVPLLAKPPLVLQAPNNPRVIGIVGPLWEKRVGSRTELYRRWHEDPRFLLDGYLKWLPPAVHDDVRLSWPPNVVGSNPSRHIATARRK